MHFYTRRVIFAHLFVIAGSLAAQSGPSQPLPDLGDSSQAVISPAQERKLGEATMRQVHASGAYLDDPEVNAYLNSLGRRLALSTTSSKQDFEFFAINDPGVNAFALPGGFIGVHTGLILLTQNESELASVLAHEISHVTQHHIARMISGEQKNQLATLAAMAIAVLAARSRPDAAGAAIATAQAANIQYQLDFSREYEREADRIGFQVLDKAGFDTRAMSSMFERLQRSFRAYENNAPNYLRTHPVTYERIADATNRAETKPYRQVADSRDFHFVRALLKSYQGTSKDAIRDFESSLAERKFNDESATRYGLVASLLRDKQLERAAKELAVLEQTAKPSAMIEAMAGQVLAQSGKRDAAIKRYQAALQRYPNHMQLVYDYPDALIETGQHGAAVQFIEGQLQRFPNDARLHQLAAKSYAALGRKLQQHAHQGEYYVRLGNLRGAIDQFELAIKGGDGNFYQISTAESRLRTLKQDLADQGKEFGKLAAQNFRP
ncbi:MAG: M48 family metallopeptidase [Betaproteobacteria bacterium]|nr:M48 family metallopeptidase [Betaproteobacteria bacterium]